MDEQTVKKKTLISVKSRISSKRNEERQGTRDHLGEGQQITEPNGTKPNQTQKAIQCEAQNAKSQRKFVEAKERRAQGTRWWPNE